MPDGAAAAQVTLTRAVLGGLRGGGGRAGRTLLAVLAIGLGVALGFAVQLINHTAIAEFTGGLATLSGTADLEVQGGRDGFAEALYAQLARDPAVAVASPVLQLEATVRGREGTLTLYGVDALRAAAVTPALVGAADERLDTLRPDTVFLSAAALDWLQLARGDTLVLQSGVEDVPLRIAGTLAGEATARLAVADVAAVQDRFARLGRLSRIDLRLRPGFDTPATAARLAPRLPAGVTIATPASRVETTARLTRAYRINLDVLALVALFTGGLLVFSTQALAVVRRRAPFALLRSLGLTQRQLLQRVVAEGAMLGLLGALLGLAAGYAIADLAVRGFGVDLGSGFFRGRAPGVVMDWTAALAFAAAGVAAAVAGSFVPAREAARAEPAAALKAGDVQVQWGTGARLWPALLALGAGVACTALPPVAGLPLFGYAAIALLLLGTLRLLPALTAALVRLVPAPRAAPEALALAHLRHTPAQSTLGLAALVAAFALMVAMAVMVASFRTSLQAWLDEVLPADLYVRARGGSDTAWLPASLQQRIVALRGVAHAEFARSTGVLLEPGAPRIALLARDIDRAQPQARLALLGAPLAPAAGDPPPAWISEAVADRLHWRVGERIALPLAGRGAAFVVAGVFRDYARQQGAIVIERAAYRRLTGDDTATEAALWLAPGATASDIRDGVSALVGDGRVEFAAPDELRGTSLAIFDRTFAVTYALEAAAVLIGLTGLSSAFGAQTLTRRREFGMLRHLGVTRAQVGRMLAAEGLALAAVGAIVGLALGFVIALILIHVVNRQSFHWSMDLAVPWPGLVALSLALLALATVTAWLSGRQAMAADAVRAVRDDW